MSFDRTTRNALARMVGQVREFLKVDVMDQLRRLGFQADGCVLDLDQIAGLTELERMAGRELRDLLEHFVALESGPEIVRCQSAFDRLAREIGFTTLNRLVALRMAEQRRLIVQAVGRGLASDGFQIYEQVARDALGNRAETYRSYLECPYDELVIDLPMLFDRTTPESRIFPSQRCLQEVLTLLNEASLAHLWKEDEAIGWVYQYYNDPDERKKMREAALTPQNSRELAVRNQFFTPRYVVEFLTDNTLGRIWYEMRQGNTQLSNQCHYLIRRPIEIFMQYDEEVPQSTETEEDISPEELLNQPIFIPFRTKKDPRDLKILDPACGSGHFLLYAFDLLETIYKEAWVDNDNPISLVTGTRLRNDYADLDALRRALPGLILRHNLYGIDIDPRACQIAALALWLRTQRSYQQLGLHGAERPQITKSNIVCAEPMPGEREMLEEYLTQYVDPRLHDLVLTIWEKMQLAGEAGTLLKIEEEIETALREARMRAMVDVQPVQVPLFEGKIAVQQSMSFTAVEEQTFWSNAEGELLGALRDYATRATNGNATQRRLFAEDATQGFAFIDLARNRFDVVLMNPPFGQSVPDGDNYIRRQYTETWNDLYAAFLERSILGLAKDGMTGCISSSLFLYTKQLRGLRQMWIDRQSLVFLVELGSGVLDAATVDTALTITRPEAINSTVFCDLTHVGMEIKGHTLLETTSNCDARLVARHLTIFQSIYSSPFCYHLTNQKLQLWNQGDRLDPNYGSVVLGNHTFDDERFLRLRWEVPHATLGHRWFGYEKGGEYQPYFAPTPLLYNWEADGKEARAYQSTRYGTDAQVSQSITWWWKPGITYPRVTSVGFGPRVMPSKHIFSSESISFFPSESYSSLALLAFLCSSWAQDLLYAFGRYRKIENRAVSNLPLSTSIFDVYTRALHEVGVKGVTLLMQLEELEETSSLFLAPAHQTKGSIGGGEKRKQLYNALVHQAAETDALVAKMLFGESVPSLAAEPRGNLVSRYVCRNDDNNAARVDSLVSYAVGCSFGRWDVRLALNSELQTKPPSPFDSLPICPPGMLLSPSGLPASQNNIVSEAWLRSRPNVISIPLGGIVRQSKISDEEYPVHIAWDGILVDDQEHSSDIVLHVREVFSVLWPGDDGALAEAIEREVCEILGVKDLHEYFRRYSGFFANHLKRYSKSRRQAPIYWPISTASGSYTLWIYYHRLTSDTLFTVVNQYIEPKITEIQRKIGELEGRLTGTTGREATRLREEVESARALLAELQDFRAELLGVAALPYRPDLNDGVSINAAPLHRLFRLPKWAKDTKACWEKLQRGEYDWAHLAYTIWPDRVREKCRVDRSLAIAHDQEHLYLEQPTMAQRKRGRKAVPDKEDEE